MAEKKRGLGRGLGALIPNSSDEELNIPGLGTAKAAATDVLVDSASSPSRQKSENTKTTPAKAPTPKQSETKPSTTRVKKPTTSTTTSEKKNVSRETSVKTSSRDKAKRADMGVALRNSTASRRPVDFFFGGDEEAQAKATDSQLVNVPGAEFLILNVKDIHPNRKQPRTDFDEQDMEELVHSIKEIGILQPIVVRPSRENGKEQYELVMGERRWRASQRAGLDTVPAIIRETQDDDLLRDALLENLHRSQLNPIEEAAAYQQLLNEFGTTQEQLAQRIGRSRPQISNTIRLLKLPALVQRRVAAGILSAGHARALLSMKRAEDIEKLAQKTVNEGLSVRAVEELALVSKGEEPKKARKTAQVQPHSERLDYIADGLSDRLDTNVKISLGARKGKMTIDFASVEDLNRIVDLLDPKLSK